MQPRWKHARFVARPDPVSPTGAGRQGNILSFRSKEKNVLDFSSYRSGRGASPLGYVEGNVCQPGKGVRVPFDWSGVLNPDRAGIRPLSVRTGLPAFGAKDGVRPMISGRI